MTHDEQAVLLWHVLAFAARMQRVLTYGEVDDLTGVLARGQADPLCPASAGNGESVLPL